MGPYTALLSALIGLLWCTAPSLAAPARNACLSCHAEHYAASGGCTDCHRGFAGTQRLAIAHQGLLKARYALFTLPEDATTQSGQQLLENYACRRCHTSAAKGNRLAANLDQSQWEKPPEELDRAIEQPVLFMPDFHFTNAQRVALINALLKGGSQIAQQSGEEVPMVVHFEGETVSREVQFEKACGGCHRLLSGRYGGLGSGEIGPNLSGLFSEFYPANFGPEKQRWSRENLEKWLKNPRQIKPFAQMPPQPLKDGEFKRLAEELDHRAAPDVVTD